MTSPHRTTISAIHTDIIRAHIMSRLDGPSLAAASCASPELHALSGDESLWRGVCAATWPSVAGDHRLRNLIAKFPGGHRSFFSDSFPDSAGASEAPAIASPGLISAVDIFFSGEPVFSKVVETETVTDWFLNSPFLVDLLEPKESAATTIPRGAADDDTWLRHLEERVTLSWIAVDPVRRRAVNLSSRHAVSARRHWLTGDVQLHYATVLEGAHVQCTVVLTCGSGAGVVHVREVGLHVEDMEGRHVSGRESLAVLGKAVTGERRWRREKGATQAKERYVAYLERRREWREKRQRREKALDLACIVAGVSIFVSFWSFILFR